MYIHKSNSLKNRFNSESGVSMFEMIIAIFIVAIVVTSIATLSTVAIRNNTFAVNKTRANNFAQQGMDLLRSERDKSFANFKLKADLLGKTWCIDDLVGGLDNQDLCSGTEFVTSDGTTLGEDTIFIREAILATLDPAVVNAKVRVSWQDGQGVHVINLDTDFTNWSKLP